MSRRTLARAITIHGRGLRSGRPCAATLAPAVAGWGVVINGARLSPARVIPGVQRATGVRGLDGPVMLVEHLLAALWLWGITDVDVIVVGGEAPILDGSAGGWVRAISPHTLGGCVDSVSLTAPIHIVEGDARISAWPAPEFSAEVIVEFPRLGAQRIAVGSAGADARRSLAEARTFGFREEAEALGAAGLIGGASLDNTVVFDEEGRPMNPGGLRWPDEPVRHKALDLVGDLMCLGRPLRAHVVATRAGHRVHQQLVAAIAERAALRG